MKISFNWLKEYISINADINEVCDKLTHSGLEVEGVEKIESIPGGLKGFVVGHILTCERHPNADKLSVTTVDLGNGEVKQIVCGAPNVAADQKVIIATVGTMLYPEGHEPFKIKKSKIRGEVSEGMICAEDEIGLGNSHDGIMVLDPSVKIGTPANELFELDDDFIIEIGLTPNRADATSHIGTARDVKALFGGEVIWPNVEQFKINNSNLPISINIKNEEACHRYCGVTIQGVEVKESPDWLKTRLKSIGLAPVNNVVDVTNFVLHECGQPLHAFDYDKLSTKNINIQTLKEGTPFTTLDDTERKLAAKDLMICDGDTPLCIAGVFGGADSGIKDGSTNVFLESAYFSPDYVRKSSQVHAIKTDASFRFERGIDPNITLYALKRAALLIQEVAGGEISSEVIDLHPVKAEAFKVEAKYKNIERLIGIVIPKERIKKILTDLDIEIESETEEKLNLLVPPYRVDVTREADIIEEILRIYGFENLPLSNKLSTDFLAEHPKLNKEDIQRNLSEILSSRSFIEITTNSLTKPEYSEYVISEDDEQNVEILNKLSEDLGVMRRTLAFSGLEVLEHNINRKQKNCKIYEFGKTYVLKNGKYKETPQLALWMSGNKHEESWKAKTDKLDFSDLSQNIALIFQKLNFEGVQIKKFSDKLFEVGAEYILNKSVIGRAGKLKKSATNKAGVKQDVFYAEFFTEKLIKQLNREVVFEELSKFPEVRRDLSLVIDKSITYEQIKEVAVKTNRKLIKEVNVFDVYEGKPLEENQKSYSVSFILQDNEKTLQDKVIDKTLSRLIQNYENELSAIIRK